MINRPFFFLLIIFWLKTENKDLATVLDWLEEFSTIKINRLDSHEQKKLISPINDHMLNPLKNKDFNSSDTFDELRCIPSDLNFISISDGIISKMEENNFNIFELEKEVGEKNILSTISCYVFSIMGFYSFINYHKFENFLQEITKGYFRTNPYHNVII